MTTATQKAAKIAAKTTEKPLTAPGLKLTDTVAHTIARSLMRHGITHVFGQSLPSMVILACEQLGIKQVAYRTENAGGYMADGYTRISNKVSVVTAQNGPAATLLVAPMAEALKASIPMVALVQDVARDHTDKNAFQEYDHLALFAGCTKWARVVTQASRVEDYIDMAFAAACSGRPGPVALMLPADLLVEKATPSVRKASLGHFPLDRMVASRDRVEAAADVLAKARRPLVIAGGGVHLSQAQDTLAALQEAAHLPVATTVMGKGAVADTHPLSVGVVGFFMGPNGATRHLRDVVTEADVILLVGNRTNQNGTDSYRLYPSGATYIHIDVDGQEIGRNYEAMRLAGDARETLAALTEALKKRDLSMRKAARPKVEEQIREGKARHEKDSAAVRHSDAAPIRPERLMAELDRVLKPEDIVVADASYSTIWITNYLTARRPGQRFLTPRGMAGLGWGFPMAMGAKLANPKVNVYCVVGDGGFGHVWSELETARRMGIKVTLMVLNNGILGFQKHAEHVKFGAHTTAVDFAPVDHAAVARAAGCEGIRVENPGDIAAALAKAGQNKSMTLIDVITEEDAYPPISVFTPEQA